MREYWQHCSLAVSVQFVCFPSGLFSTCPTTTIRTTDLRSVSAMARPLTLIIIISLFARSQQRPIQRRMFKQAAGAKYRVVDEFGGEVTVMRPNCYMKFGCEGANAEPEFLDKKGKPVKVNFTRIGYNKATNTTILLLSWSMLGQRLDDEAELRCSGEKGQKRHLAFLNKDNYYHLCGKEQCQEKRCDEGEMCIFKKGNDQCSKGKVIGAKKLCGIHTEQEDQDICCDDDKGEPVLSKLTTECKELLLLGYTPRFNTTSKDVCKKGMFVYSCLF